MQSALHLSFRLRHRRDLCWTDVHLAEREL